MKIIRNIPHNIKWLFDDLSYNQNINYVQTIYLYKQIINDKCIYFNSLTKAIVETDANEELSPTEETVRLGFFFGEDVNQYEYCNNIKNKIRNKTLSEKSKAINYYVIFTTMSCNARCSYCFERDYDNKIMMPDNIALDTAKYIYKHMDKNQKLRLQWFGGEPLLNTKAMDIICDYMESNGIEYSSSIITNGYLLNTIEDKIISKYHLERAQITLDGAFDDYNSVKNYVYKNDIDPFSVVMNNIKMLLEHNVYVRIRLNVTDTNYEQMKTLIEYLNNKFYDDNFIIYAASIYLDRDDPNYEERYKTINTNTLKVQELIASGRNNLELGGFESHENIRAFHCMADVVNGLCITPTGNLTVCEHHVNDDFVGNIYSDEPLDKKMIEKYRVEVINDNCLTCPHYPMCHEIDRCGGRYDCGDEYRVIRNTAVYRKIKRWYTNYKDSIANPNVNGIQNSKEKIVYLPESIVK